MSLVSPGVEVTIIDESQYSSAAQNTVPYILMATAQDKLTPAGTALAPGTLASALGDVYLITSQRELVNTFGNPTFYKTSGGNALHAYELNEYGLMAAYSVLGATNRAYIQRVDVDMAELEASLVRPIGDPADGTYWFDLNESAYGLFVWNGSTNTFTNVTPLVINDDADLDAPGGVPLASIGQINSYAIVTTDANNSIYRKNEANTWVLIGSVAWKVSIATVIGNTLNATVTTTGGFDIITDTTPGPTTIAATSGQSVDDLVTTITGAVPDVTAANVNGNLEIYFAPAADETLTINNATGTVLTDFGIDITVAPLGVYNSPTMAHETHVNVPRWRGTDIGEYRPTGSIWQKTTSVNAGASIVIKKYDSVTDTFVEQSAPLYANDQTANKALDPGTGGANIPGGDTYVQYDVAENDTGTMKLFVRTEGATSVTGSAILTAIGDFTISASAATGVMSTPVQIDPTTTSIVDLAALINGKNIANVEASVTTAGTLNITHIGGGVIVIVDGTNTPITVAGITTGTTNVRAGNNTDLILSNWNFLTYTADTAVPGLDPIHGTRWYYSAIDEVDIMIHEGGAWLGYQMATNDARGHDLALTDPLGPTVAATAPTTQQDGIAALEYGDLWIDTSDLEAYAVIRRWEHNITTVQDEWVLIDNADQTSVNGILFADARWDISGTTDPVTGDMTTIVEMLGDDYVDPDAPDKALYPDGMLLWNTRRSGYNVKEFRVNYFNNSDFDLSNFPSLTETATWVTVSGLKEDGSANFGRQAQRALVVQAMKAAIDTNSDIREEQRQFNIMACPGYPELIPNMVALNNERSNTAFIIGDSPMRLENSGTAIANWASNNDGLGTATGDGLASNDEYMGVFYPSGRTNDLAGTSVIVPPSHMILRTIIHSDEQSYQWLAPAGVRRGQVDNVDAIGYVDGQTGEFQQMSTRQGVRDVLYTNNVNPITFIPGAGIVNYGNKTTKAGSALDRINVSRLVSYIRVQVDSLAKQFVFEPNDKLTRDEIKGQMERLLNDLVAKRGLYDYVVVCDKSNNTNVRIDRNELWVDIAVEPVKSAEFIYVPVRIQNTGDISGG